MHDQDQPEPSEIKSLLEDVRGLLSSTLKKSPPSKKSPRSPRSPRARQRKKVDDKWLTDSLKLGRNSEKLNEYLNSFDQNSTSASLVDNVVQSFSPMNSTPNGKSRKKVTIDEDQSSVYSFEYTTDDDSEHSLQPALYNQGKGLYNIFMYHTHLLC